MTESYQQGDHRTGSATIFGDVFRSSQSILGHAFYVVTWQQDVRFVRYAGSGSVAGRAWYPVSQHGPDTRY